MRNAAVSYDVLCIHIHVTVHWLVRNTAVRPTRCYDFGILFLHYICFLTGYSMVNISSKGCYYFSPNRSAFLGSSLIFIFERCVYDETVLRGYTAVWQNMSTGIADVSPAIGWTYCSLVVNLGFSRVDVTMGSNPRL